jgi:GT2 family glycosyltransferase
MSFPGVPPQLSISLVSLNHRADLERLLPTLRESLRGLSAEILVVENRPGCSCDIWLRSVPDVVVERNFRRTGYGGNHNLNLRRARGQFFVIMNVDMTVQANTFSALLTMAEEHPDAVMLGARVLNPDGTCQGLNKRYPSLLDLGVRFVPILRNTAFARRRNDRYEMRDVGYESPAAVEFISGAFMFCRTEVLRAVHGFDERYFLYFEDVDLCRRMGALGRALYCPEATVIHFWQRSAHKSARYTWIFFCSALRYFLRWGFRLW